MSGLMDSLGIAKKGMFVQQNVLDISAHNISNANTPGYSRQVANIKTSEPFPVPSMGSSVGPGQIGTGVVIDSIKRIRDSFIDFQIRNATSKLSQYDAKSKYLNEVEGVFGALNETSISKQLGDFYNSWDQLSKQPQSIDSKTVVVQKTATLANTLNQTFNMLQNIKNSAQEEIKNTVFNTSSKGGTLDQINSLNLQIRSIKISEQEPNDLMDKRDLLLDKLSSDLNVDITQKSYYGIDVNTTATKSATNDGVNLSDNALIKADPNTSSKKLSYITSIKYQDVDASGSPAVDASGNPILKDGFKAGVSEYYVTYLKNGDSITPNSTGFIKVSGIDSADKYNTIDKSRVLWADNNGTAIQVDGTAIAQGTLQAPSSTTYANLALYKPLDNDKQGSIGGFMEVQKSVTEYMNELNNFAKTLAFSVNAILSGKSTTVDISGAPTDFTPYFVNASVANFNYTKQGDNTVIFNPLDTNSISKLKNVLDAEKDITAGNISINKQLLDSPTLLKVRTNDNKYKLSTDNKEDASGDSSRASAVVNLKDTLLNISSLNSNATRASFISGTNALKPPSGLGIVSDPGGMKLDSYFKSMINKIAIDTDQASKNSITQNNLLISLTQTKDSTSGVSLDEEMANMVQYTHAYQANAKVIATVDQLLDVVVNGLKK